MEISGLFTAKEISIERLLRFGFLETEAGLSYAETISGGAFRLTVLISRTGLADYTVTDTESGEEYALVKASVARGPFVDAVRTECEETFARIRENCFKKGKDGTGQMNRLISHIREIYGARPEFLWEKYPSLMVFRHQENKKWFALLMTLPAEKLDARLHGEISAADLRADALCVQELVGRPGCYPGYHMNKKYWYTVVLDGTMSDEEIFERVKESFEATKE